MISNGIVSVKRGVTLRLASGVLLPKLGYITQVNRLPTRRRPVRFGVGLTVDRFTGGCLRNQQLG